MKPNVIETIVQKNLCIGCGVCAGICPANVLKIEFNEYGEYNPVESPGCLRDCNLCLQVCPFYGQNENEDNTLAKAVFDDIDGIKHRSETGYYLDSYVGYSNIDAHRANGASGGMATWLLETFLTKNFVDYVVCVTPNNDSEKLFRFAIFDDIESIRRSAKSVYYPVEMSEVIQEIIKNKGRYAITGQPCFLKAIRLATKENKKLRERIIITVGLVCGQMKSKHYTTYLASLSGVNGRLKSINYRGKSPEKPASNYFFYCVNETNNEGKIFLDEGVGKVWSNRWFTPNACNFCDDVFAELADVTVMDAWLPKYSQESKGTNLVIVRSTMINNLIKSGVDKNQIKAEQIPIDNIIDAQIGVLNIKRTQLAYRLYLAKQKGLLVPTKRITPSRKVGLLNRKEVEIKDKIQTLSRELFLRYYNQEKLNLKAFSQKMNCFIKELERWNRLGLILRFPIRVTRKARRMLHGA